jgi:hypothetical protein
VHASDRWATVTGSFNYTYTEILSMLLLSLSQINSITSKSNFFLSIFNRVKNEETGKWRGEARDTVLQLGWEN